MKIFLHDFAGHPFGFELSRELARRGHTVRHVFFAQDSGPKGAVSRSASDPDSFSIAPISIAAEYSKTNLVKRHLMDRIYRQAAAAAMTDFGPDLVIAANTPPNALDVLQAAARRRGVTFVLWLQDIFGAAADALLRRRRLGLGALAAGHYQRLEARLMRASDGVIAISDDFLPYLAAAGVAAERVTVIPHWGPLSEIAPRSKANPWPPPPSAP